MNVNGSITYRYWSTNCSLRHANTRGTALSKPTSAVNPVPSMKERVRRRGHRRGGSTVCRIPPEGSQTAHAGPRPRFAGRLEFDPGTVARWLQHSRVAKSIIATSERRWICATIALSTGLNARRPLTNSPSIPLGRFFLTTSDTGNLSVHRVELASVNVVELHGWPRRRCRGSPAFRPVRRAPRAKRSSPRGPPAADRVEASSLWIPVAIPRAEAAAAGPMPTSRRCARPWLSQLKLWKSGDGRLSFWL